MITKKKFLELIRKLLEKARAGQVRWFEEDGLYENCGRFAVKFREGQLYVKLSSPPTTPDVIEIGVRDAEGEPLKHLAIEEDEADLNWHLFLEIYQEAERSASGSDRVFSEIEEALNAEGAIGLS